MTSTPPSAVKRWSGALPMTQWWPMVTRQTLRADAIAGFTGALVVLPQAVAFATIAGLPPEYGLYAAMVPVVVAALFGSSWHLVSGPTTALSIVVYASISPLADPGTADYLGLVLTMTLLAGLIQLAMGLARLGALVDFFSHTVILGFTAGAAILIAASQVKNFFGIDIPREARLHEVVVELVTNLDAVQPWVLLVSTVTLLVGIVVKRVAPRMPYMIFAMVAGSVVAVLVGTAHDPEDTGIRTVGALGSPVPPLSLPDLSPEALGSTLFPAAVVALLGLSEAMAIARSMALKSGQRLDNNQEFVGQGLANVVGAFFSSYTSSGSFNRSGVNYSSGARTPLAAASSAAFLLLILLLVSPLVAYLPVASMAAVLFIVALGLVDWHHIGPILRRHPAERIVLLVTFVGTLVDLESGIFVGVLISLLFYLQRTSRPSVREMVPDATRLHDPRRKWHPAAPDEPRCPQLAMLRVEGSLFFGAVDYVSSRFRALDDADPPRRQLVVTAKPIGFSDLAGAEMLGHEAVRRREIGGDLWLVGVQPDLASMLQRSEQDAVVGDDHVFRHKGEALRTIYDHLDSDICRDCPARIFQECHERLPDGTPRADA